MALFSNKQESNLRSCIAMIEDVLGDLGHDVAASRLETKTPMPAWRIAAGSAFVYLMIYDEDGDNHLQVTAPVMHLEGPLDLPRLYQRLLELNAGEIKGAAFALKESVVVLVAERSTVDLDRSEVKDLVEHVCRYAEQWDKKLVAEFGGRMAGLSLSPVR